MKNGKQFAMAELSNSSFCYESSAIPVTHLSKHAFHNFSFLSVAMHFLCLGVKVNIKAEITLFTCKNEFMVLLCIIRDVVPVI